MSYLFLACSKDDAALAGELVEGQFCAVSFSVLFATKFVHSAQ